jgi:hypothetical protein
MACITATARGRTRPDETGDTVRCVENRASSPSPRHISEWLRACSESRSDENGRWVRSAVKSCAGRSESSQQVRPTSLLTLLPQLCAVQQFIQRTAQRLEISPTGPGAGNHHHVHARSQAVGLMVQPQQFAQSSLQPVTFNCPTKFLADRKSVPTLPVRVSAVRHH